MVKRATEWISISKPGDNPEATYRQLDETGNVLNSWNQPLAFDPRTRPWYELANADASETAIHWTAPYGFVPTGDPGITASVRVIGPRAVRLLPVEGLSLGQIGDAPGDAQAPDEVPLHFP